MSEEYSFGAETSITSEPCCNARVERVNDVIFLEWYTTRILIGLLVCVYPLGLLALMALAREAPIETSLYTNAGGYVYVTFVCLAWYTFPIIVYLGLIKREYNQRRRDAVGKAHPEELETPREKINYTFCVIVTSLVLATVVNVAFLVIPISRVFFIVFTLPTIIGFLLGTVVVAIFIVLNILSLLLSGTFLNEQMVQERKPSQPASSMHGVSV